MGPLIGAALPSIISGGANLIGGALNAWSTGRQNRKSQEWSHPAAQMDRLKQAGLNPALMYRQGAGGAGGGQPQFVAPDYGQAVTQGATAYLHTMLDLEAKEKSNELLDTKIWTERANQQYTEMQRANMAFDLGFKRDSRISDLQYKRGLAEHQRMQIYTGWDENTRRWIMQGYNQKEILSRIAKTTQDIRLSKAQIENIFQDTQMKKYEARLRSLGLSYNDHLIVRALALGAKWVSKEGNSEKLGTEMNRWLDAIINRSTEDLPPWAKNFWNPAWGVEPGMDKRTWKKPKSIR